MSLVLSIANLSSYQNPLTSYIAASDSFDVVFVPSFALPVHCHAPANGFRSVISWPGCGELSALAKAVSEASVAAAISVVFMPASNHGAHRRGLLAGEIKRAGLEDDADRCSHAGFAH